MRSRHPPPAASRRATVQAMLFLDHLEGDHNPEAMPRAVLSGQPPPAAVLQHLAATDADGLRQVILHAAARLDQLEPLDASEPP